MKTLDYPSNMVEVDRTGPSGQLAALQLDDQPMNTEPGELNAEPFHE